MAEFQEVARQYERMCDYFKDKFGCESCPLCSSKNESGKSCVFVFYSEPRQAEEIIMKWAKEHPMQTNADKFKEVFGMELFHDGCGGVSCPSDDTKCKECIYKDFWNQEYKEPKGE